jgi:biopolymer transport protein ExbD
MAFTSGGSGGLTNEINVTPMIDVLLVLLIIFMAALPTMRKTVDVQLPDPTPSIVPQNAQSNQIVLEVNSDGTYSINSEKVAEDRLGPRLKEIYDPRPEKIIFVKGDSTVKYERVVHAMDVSRGAGVKVIGVPPKDTPGSAK